jgi:hypothetical protein
MTDHDQGMAMYERRMHLAVWRSYAVQVVACVSGALIVWCAAQCALDGHYGWSATCSSLLVLNFVTFSYAARDRAHAHKTLDMLMLDDTGGANADRNPFGDRGV